MVLSEKNRVKVGYGIEKCVALVSFETRCTDPATHGALCQRHARGKRFCLAKTVRGYRCRNLRKRELGNYCQLHYDMR